MDEPSEPSKYKCSLCSYNSTKKYNLDRHVGKLHTDQPQQIVAFTTTVTAKNPSSGLACDGCTKTFASTRTLRKHKLTCKGFIVNPLQCQHCNKEFALRSCKSKHLKICPVAKQKSENSSPCTENQTNITNNTTNITNNINNITVNLIQVNWDSSDPIPFVAGSLDNVEALRELFSKDDFYEMYHDLCMKTMSQPENKIVKKTNMSRNYSMIWKDNAWKVISDDLVYFRLARGISTNALVLSDKHKRRVHIPDKYLESLQTIQIDSELSPNTASEDDDTSYSKITKKCIQTAKNVVYETGIEAC
jgi:hypothetical protein